jgi:hypothetical protein
MSESTGSRVTIPSVSVVAVGVAYVVVVGGGGVEDVGGADVVD